MQDALFSLILAGALLLWVLGMLSRLGIGDVMRDLARLTGRMGQRARRRVKRRRRR